MVKIEDVTQINIELVWDKDKDQLYLKENGVYKAQFAYVIEGKVKNHYHVPECKATNRDGVGTANCSCKISDLRDGCYRILVHNGKVIIRGRDGIKNDMVTKKRFDDCINNLSGL